VVAAALRSLFVDAATGARFTALERARGRLVVKRKGPPVDATKRHRVDVPCMPNETVVTVPGGDA
jgi:hypothetical protein